MQLGKTPRAQGAAQSSRLGMLVLGGVLLSALGVAGPVRGLNQAPQAAERKEARAAPPLDAAKPEIGVAKVGGRTIATSALLERLWVRDNALAREMVEHLVFAELALLEAERIGIALEPELVDATLARAKAALEAKLQQSSRPLSFEEHVRRNLSMDPKRYERALRRDSIVQLLLERCVRVWFEEQGSARVRAAEFEGEEALAAVQRGLAAGQSLEALSRAHAARDAQTGGRMLDLARAESNDLARLAFATKPGSVGGPLSFEGRQLFLEVQSIQAPKTGDWEALGASVGAGLQERPLTEFEFAQWRDAMLRRYPVDLSPMLDLVGD